MPFHLEPSFFRHPDRRLRTPFSLFCHPRCSAESSSEASESVSASVDFESTLSSAGTCFWLKRLPGIFAEERRPERKEVCIAFQAIGDQRYELAREAGLIVRRDG